MYHSCSSRKGSKIRVGRLHVFLPMLSVEGRLFIIVPIHRGQETTPKVLEMSRRRRDRRGIDGFFLVCDWLQLVQTRKFCVCECGRPTVRATFRRSRSCPKPVGSHALGIPLGLECDELLAQRSKRKDVNDNAKVSRTSSIAALRCSSVLSMAS